VEIPECPKPTNVHASSTTITSMTVNWTPGNNETSWRVKHRRASTSIPWTEVPVSGTPTLTINGLAPNTTYDVCVVAICVGQVTVNSEDGCGVIATTGIEDLSLNNSVKIYPNPADKNLTIAMETPFQTIEVSNILGEVVYSAQINVNELQLDVAAYCTGVYFVKLQGKEGVVTKKFVKK
jgi:hypothetical protein